MNDPTLFVNCAPPGSGKSTFAKRLEAFGVKHIERDEVRSEFGEYTGEKRECVMMVLEGRVRGNLLNGRSVVVDANHVQPDQRWEVFHFAKRMWTLHGRKVRKVCLFFPGTLEQSMERRKEELDSGELDPEVITKQYYKLVRPDTSEGFHVYQIDALKTDPRAVLEGPIWPHRNVNLTAGGSWPETTAENKTSLES